LRKNIQKTLRLKQQLRLSYRLLSTKIDRYTIHTRIGPMIKLSPMDIELYNRYSDHYGLNNVFFVFWIKIKGILYNAKNMSRLLIYAMKMTCYLYSDQFIYLTDVRPIHIEHRIYIREKK